MTEKDKKRSKTEYKEFFSEEPSRKVEPNREMEDEESEED